MFCGAGKAYKVVKKATISNFSVGYPIPKLGKRANPILLEVTAVKQGFAATVQWGSTVSLCRPLCSICTSLTVTNYTD